MLYPRLMTRSELKEEQEGYAQERLIRRYGASSLYRVSRKKRELLATQGQHQPRDTHNERDKILYK